MSRPLQLTAADFSAMAPWVERVLKLPFRERVALVDKPTGATAPAEAWERVKRYADPDSGNMDAQERLPALMRDWMSLYTTPKGRAALGAVLRQQRHRRKVGVVTVDLPSDLHEAFTAAAKAQGVPLVELLRTLAAQLPTAAPPAKLALPRLG